MGAANGGIDSGGGVLDAQWCGNDDDDAWVGGVVGIGADDVALVVWAGGGDIRVVVGSLGGEPVLGAYSLLVLTESVPPSSWILSLPFSFPISSSFPSFSLSPLLLFSTLCPRVSSACVRAASAFADVRSACALGAGG